MDTTLVLGASLQKSRYSNLAIHKLLQANKKVIGIGKQSGSVEKAKIQTNFDGISNIDTITMYVSPKVQENYYEQIIRLKPKRVIFNPGSENPELEQILREHHIPFERACTLVLLSTNQY